MADVEGRLISRVVKDRVFRPVLDAQITDDWFKDDEHHRVFGFLAEHYRRHGEVPSADHLKIEFPNYRLLKVEDSLEPLVDQLQDRRNYGRMVELLQDAGEVVDRDKDWRKASDIITAGVSGIIQESSKLQDVDLTKTWEDRLDRYDMRAENTDELLGIPTGFKTIDLATSGWQRKQLVTVIATPKIGKSTLAMRMALHAWQAGYRVLFLSFEMSNDEQEARHDAMISGIPHKEYMRGKLDRNQYSLLERALTATEGMHPFILSADINSVTTVSGIAGKIEQHKPDIVFVDGVYLLRDELGEAEGSPQALTNITRNLKRLCQRADIPIVASTQALLSKVNKRKGVQADSIGYSSSFAQDSDVILGLQEDSTGNDDARELRVVMSRNCARLSVGLVWDWTTSTFEEPTWDEDVA